jgi:hypothetical protein
MKIKARGLAQVGTPRDRASKSRHCRICLAAEVITMRGQEECSSLRNGICRDRAACEERQPPLFGETP